MIERDGRGGGHSYCAVGGKILANLHTPPFPPLASKDLVTRIGCIKLASVPLGLLH